MNEDEMYEFYEALNLIKQTCENARKDPGGTKMKKALRELIDNAPSREGGLYDNFLIVSNGKYNGFWGRHGYNNILLLGFNKQSKEWCLITDQSDVLLIMDIKSTFHLDIPEEYGVPRIWFDNPVEIASVRSTVFGEERKED